MTTCPYCSHDVQDAATACVHCGRDLVTPPNDEATTREDPAPRAGTLAVGVLAFVGAAALVTAVVTFVTRPAPPAGEAAAASEPAPAARSVPEPSSIETPSAASSASIGAAIREAGETCDLVTRLFTQGVNEYGRIFYNVACTDGNSYSISSNGNGDEDRIVSCRELKMIANVDCFKPFTVQ